MKTNDYCLLQNNTPQPSSSTVLKKLTKTVRTVRNSLLALTLAGSVHADEITVPAGVSIFSATPAQLGIMQSTSKSIIDLGINTAPDMTGQRITLVNTSQSTTLGIASGQEMPVFTFGDHDRFFARINTNGNPEVSTDLVNWSTYSSGTEILPSREEGDTVSDLSAQLNSLEQLTENQQVLQTQLTLDQQTLGTLQTALNQASSQLTQANAQLDSTQSTLSGKELEKGELVGQLQPESQLRSDIHTIAGDPNLGDGTKTSSTQTALTTYDNASNSQSVLGLKIQSAGKSISSQTAFTPPTTLEVTSTKNLLTQELSRLQTQINDVSAQITAKQNEITTTQNSINSLQTLVNSLDADKVYWTTQYNYWRSEYTRLRNLADTYANDMARYYTNYYNDKTLLNNAGRSDIPSNIDAPNVASQISSLKTTILAEYNVIPNTPNTGTNGTEKNLPDETSSIRTHLDSSYYYVIDFPTSGNSWPATLRTYIKYVGTSSYVDAGVYAGLKNRTITINTFNNTAKPKIERLAQYRFVDTVFETSYDNYKTAKDGSTSTIPLRDAAKTNRDNAETELLSTTLLLLNKQALLTALIDEKALLTQQKADLDALKTLKANLQTLYNRVQTILNQLQSHVTSYDQLTAEISQLLQLSNTLQAQVNSLTNLVDVKTVEVATQNQQVLGTSTLINQTTQQLTAEQTALLAKIARMDITNSRDQIGDKVLTYPQIAQYFSYGYRTSKGAINLLTGFTVDSIVQYLDNGVPEDIYPAKLFYRYKVGENVYFTDASTINNLEHKGAMGDIQKNALIQLKLSLDIANGTGDVNQNMRLMWESIRTELGKLKTPTVANTSLRDYYNDRNTITRDILMTGGSQTFFDHLIATDSVFKGKIDSLVAAVATNNGIETGSDQYADLARTLTHILARQFGELLVSQNFSGLTLYTAYAESASAFVSSVTNTINSTPDTVDINDTWEVDTHGNKYRFGLYGTTYPKTLWMNYSPDGQNTQTMGPVRVKDATELNDWKERYKKDLLAAKKSHANYNGGAYDIFQGWDEKGEKVWWGQYISGELHQGTGFQSSLSTLELQIRNIIDSAKSMSDQFKYDFLTYVYKGNLSAALLQKIYGEGKTVTQFIQEHEGTEKFELLMQKLKDELFFADFTKFQALVGNGGACDIKRNPDFDSISFEDPETGESSVFINGTVISRSQLGNFLVGYGGKEIGADLPIVYAGSLLRQIETYSDNKATYGFQNLNLVHISQLAELNEREDRFLYLAGYTYHSDTSTVEIGKYLELMRGLSLKQAESDKAEIDRIKDLDDTN